METHFEDNDFFNYLTSKQPNRYKDVIKNCYSLCLPQNGSFDHKQLNDNFVCLHILKPSPLLKSHFITCNTKLQNLHVQFKDNEIIVRNGFNDDKPSSIAILAEQKAYNNANQAYNIYLIETPFLSSPKRTLSNELAPTACTQAELATHGECRQYLNALSANNTKNLENKLTNLFDTLILLPEYIDDVRMRLKRIVDDSLPIFEHIAQTKNILKQQNIELVLECFCVGLIYNRLLPLIQQKFRNNDGEFYENTLKIYKKCHNPTELGAQEVFRRFVLTNDVKELLNNCHKLPTPLEKMKNMHRILDRINGLLKNTVEQSKSPFEKQNNTVYITSDDLIPTLVHVLSIVQPKQFCSEMYFIEMFNFTRINISELQYSLVTFQVVKEFIQSYNSHDVRLQVSDFHKNNNNNNNAAYQNRNHNKQPRRSTFRQESQLDRELDKISKLLQDSNSTMLPRTSFDSNLGSFLGSLADNLLTSSGNKNI